LGTVSDFYQAVFITSIVAFVILTAFCVAYYFLQKLPSMVVHILAFLDFILQITVVVLFSRLMGKMS
jgi:hypothetical protein